MQTAMEIQKTSSRKEGFVWRWHLQHWSYCLVFSSLPQRCDCKNKSIHQRRKNEHSQNARFSIVVRTSCSAINSTGICLNCRYLGSDCCYANGSFPPCGNFAS